MRQPIERQGKPSELPSANRERLDSWKEIAAFLGRGVRTVQRWERVEKLPVHRHVHETGGTVFAYKDELEQWSAGRQTLPDVEPDPKIVEFMASPPAPAKTSNGWMLGASGAALVVLLAALLPDLVTQERATFGPPSIVMSNIGRISQTVLSPDGSRIVYCWNGDREVDNLDLYVRDIRSGANRRLTSHPNNDHSAAWSRSGDRIAFLRDKAGVFVMGSSGESERLLEAARPDTVYGVGMSWSRDGRWLVYSERESLNQPTKLFILELSSRKRWPISDAGGSSKGDVYPSFSPDARAVAFIRSWAGGDSSGEVLRLTEDGKPAGTPVQVSFEHHNIAGQDWLRDGGGLVYSSDRAGPRRLWVARYSRWTGRWSAPALLSPAGDEAWQPSVARDGDLIAYSRRFWNASIWRISLKPGALPLRLIGSTRMDGSPAYSPNGKRLAFVSDRSGSREIWISDQDGHNETQLTRLRHAEPERPAWSPDGGRIAFSLHSGASQGIHVIGASGGFPKRITPESQACNSPAWSDEGRFIYCASLDGTRRIWRFPAEGGQGVAITSGQSPHVSQDGRWLYFIREGALWRRSIGGGAESKLIGGPVGDFTVTDRGVYFDRGSGDYTKAAIAFYDPAAGTVNPVMELERRKSGGLAVSPDHETVLVPLNERQGSEVLLVSANESENRLDR